MDRSFLPLLDGRPSVWLDRTLFIQSHRGDVPVRYHHFAARNQRWKLLHASGFGKEGFRCAPRLELYDMQLDPLETREVSRFFPEVVKEMTVAYDRWFDDVAATRPNNYAPTKNRHRIDGGKPHLAHPPGLAPSPGQAVGRQLQWALVGALDAAWLLSRHCTHQGGAKSDRGEDDPGRCVLG